MDYTDLFVTERQEEFVLRGETLHLIFKVINDSAEAERIRRGRLASRQVVKQAKDGVSVLYQLVEQELAILSFDEMVERCLNDKLQTLRRAAVDEVLPVYEEDVAIDNLLDDAAQAEHKEAIDAEVESERRRWLADNLESQRQALEQLSDADLRQKTRDAIINEMAMEAFIAAFKNTTLYHAVDIVDGQGRRRLFPSVEFLEKIETDLKNRLFARYLELDRATADPNF